MDSLVIFLEKHSVTVTVIDPYDKEFYQFQNEAEAYDMFIEKCGHDAYLTMAKSIVSTIKPTLLMGFSAGANVLWRLSEWKGLGDARLLCFYPSQIRHHLGIIPRVSTYVIFPHHEDSFNVHTVSEKIQCHALVQVKITVWSHGFMNRCSLAYSQEAKRWGWYLIEKEISSNRSP